MGYRAYVVKAGSDSEHTSNEYFNKMNVDLMELFDSHGIQYEDKFVRRRKFHSERITEWVFKDAELKKLIAVLEKSPDEVNECFPDDKPYTNRELADTFKEWVKQADKETGLIIVHWL